MSEDKSVNVDAGEALAAAASIERLAQQYQHMVRAAEALKAVGVAANTLHELEEQIALARRTKAEVDEQVDLARQMLAELREQAALVMGNANQEGAQAIEAAKATAARIVQDAVAKGREVAEEGTVEREANLAKARETLTAIGAQVADARQELEQLLNMRGAKALELDQIDARLQAARAAAAQILSSAH